MLESVEKERWQKTEEEVKTTGKSVHEGTGRERLATLACEGATGNRTCKDLKERKDGRTPFSSFSVKEFLRPFLQEGTWLEYMDSRKRSSTDVGGTLCLRGTKDCSWATASPGELVNHQPVPKPANKVTMTSGR